MDSLIQGLITSIPNIGVALWMLYQQQQTIKAMLDNQTKLIDQLMTYVTQDKQMVQQMVSNSASASAQTPERSANNVPH